MKWLVAIFILAPISLLCGAWALMLVFGVLHHEVAAAIPPIGYWPALAITAVLGLYRGVGAGFKEAIAGVLK